MNYEHTKQKVSLYRPICAQGTEDEFTYLFSIIIFPHPFKKIYVLKCKVFNQFLFFA